MLSACSSPGLGLNRDGQVSIPGYDVPGAWVLTANPLLLEASGRQPSESATKPCFTGEPDTAKQCLEALNLHSELSYQPADRYWTFQWLESGVYLLLALLLAGFAFWRIPRGLS